MNTNGFRKEVSDAIGKIAKKHKVDVKVDRVLKVDDHREVKISIMELVADKAPRVRGKKSRLEQVKALLAKGINSPKEIANKLKTHPSYVSVLKHRIEAAA